MTRFAKDILDRILGKEKFKVFLLEDNRLFLESLKFQLDRSFDGEVEVRAFQNSKTLKECMSECPDVVVMDYHLDEYSDMEGVELIKRLKWSNPSSKLIVLSCEEKVNVAMQCYEHGVDNFIKKNIDSIRVLMKELIYKRDLVARH